MAMTAAEVLRRYDEGSVFGFGIRITDVNQKDVSGDTPLHVAAVRGILDEVEALLKAGANVNEPGDVGYTPLHEAVEQGHIEVVKRLLQAGASMEARNEFGDTARDIANRRGPEEIVRILDDWGKGR
jgi:ankyrin repeat protein